MRKYLILIGLVLSGCISNPQHAFRQEMEKTFFWFEYPSGSLAHTIPILEQRINADLAEDRKIHLILGFPVVQGAPSVDEKPLPVQTRPILDAAQRSSVMMAIENVAKIAGLEVRLVPEERAIVLCRKGQQPSLGDSSTRPGLGTPKK